MLIGSSANVNSSSTSYLAIGESPSVIVSEDLGEVTPCIESKEEIVSVFHSTIFSGGDQHAFKCAKTAYV